MTIVTNPERRAPSRILEDLPVGALRGFGAAVEDAFAFSPGPASLRLQELEQAQFGRFGAGLPAGSGVNTMRRAQGLPPLPQQELDRRSGLSPMLTAEAARARAGDLGLDIPDEGIREAVLDILIARKREENARRNVLSRAPGLAAISGSVVGSMLDPLNIAASFVPVVGEARFAAMAHRIGVTGARAGRGAVEGVAGAALVEPIVLSAARAEQADYDMLDSLLNVGFGTFVGGGLHVLGGAGADLARRAAGRPTLAQQLGSAAHETREALLRAAVAQAADDRAVRVDPVLAAEERQLRLAFDEVNARPFGPTDDPLVRLRPEAFEEVIVERGPALERGGEIVVQGRELERIVGSRSGFGLVKVIVRHGPRSSKEPRFQVNREDLAALPGVLREFEPSRVHRTDNGAFAGADYRVTLPNEEFGPREIVFGIRRFSGTDGESRLVTAFVVEPGRDGGLPAARPTKNGAPGSSAIGFKPTGGDTAPGRFDPAQGGRVAPTRNMGPDTPVQQELFEDWRQDSAGDFNAAEAVDVRQRAEPPAATPEAERAAVEADLAELEAERADLRARQPLDPAAAQAIAAAIDANRPAGLEVVIHTAPAKVTGHADFAAAKGGDAEAARRMVDALVKPERIEAIRASVPEEGAVVVPVRTADNALPQALGERVAGDLGLPVDAAIVGRARIRRRGASAAARAANRPAFEGPVEAGRAYILVDDHVVQGGTLAALRDHIAAGGGRVVAVTTLSAGRSSRALEIKPATLKRLRQRLGPETESYIARRFGRALEQFTEAEAQRLLASEINFLAGMVGERRRADAALAETAARAQAEADAWRAAARCLVR